jgi:hypothetical protein
MNLGLIFICQLNTGKLRKEQLTKRPGLIVVNRRLNIPVNSRQWAIA